MSTALGFSVLDSSLYIPELKSKRRESVIQEMVARADRVGAVRDQRLLVELLSLRERLGSTAIGKGVALPNARSIAVIEQRVVAARSHRGLDWPAADGAPIQLVLLVLSPADRSEDAHTEWVARAAAIVRLQRNRQRLLSATSFELAAVVLRELIT